jgi:cytochrome c-type biogenesis protein CcmH/NrfF
MRRGLLLLAVVIGLGAPSMPAAAQDPDTVANRISETIMSPFCPGLTLHDCPSDAASDLRSEIKGWAAAGWSEDRIITRLEDEYGSETIRATPPTRGIGLVAWLLPGLFLFAGLGIALTLGRRWSARTSDLPADDTGTPIARHDRERIESELSKLRGDLS